MLEHLEFRGVGPAPHMAIDFKPRINLLAGDNGLGKTFLLDAAWWALTRTWARGALVPPPPPAISKAPPGKAPPGKAPPGKAPPGKAPPCISYRLMSRTKGSIPRHSFFDREAETWSIDPGRPAIPGLVLYAQADGGFSVWDPARNYWKGENPDRPPAYLMTPEEVWKGAPLNSSDKFCNGLIDDWAFWQAEDGDAFAQLKRVLASLGETPAEPLKPGLLRSKVSKGDSRRYPTLIMPYGEIPVIHLSSGVRRIIALAYLLVWAWQEHVAAQALEGKLPFRKIIFLIDEIEAHLHPRWQRTIIPALLDVMHALTGRRDAKVQLIAATHSPMVLSSLETRFEVAKDVVWELDLDKDDQVVLSEFPWHRRGDANAWLTSTVFDLKEPRSLEAEDAITRARLLLREEAPTPKRIREVDQALLAALGDIDPFWVRWAAWREERIGR